MIFFVNIKQRLVFFVVLLFGVLSSYAQIDLHQLKSGQLGFGLMGQTSIKPLAKTIRIAPILNFGVLEFAEFHLVAGTNLVSDPDDVLGHPDLVDQKQKAKIQQPVIIGSGFSTVYPIEELGIDLIGRIYGDLKLIRAQQQQRNIVTKLLVDVNFQLGVSKRIRLSDNLTWVPYACWNHIRQGRRIEILGQLDESEGEASNTHLGFELETPNINFSIDLDGSPGRRLTLMTSYHPRSKPVANTF